MNQLTPEPYDVVIIGSGEGGKYLAWTFAREGRRVAVVERDRLGGSCPNIACLPSKSLIHSAKIVSYLRQGHEVGASGELTVNMRAIRERKRAMVAELAALHQRKFTEYGPDVIAGSGRFTGPRTVEVLGADGGRRLLLGANVVIGTGSRAVLPSIPGLREARPLTHVEALELGEVPPHLLVVGAGYVGLEFAQAMRRFGSRVTVIDHNGRLLSREDRDVSEGLATLFAEEGIATELGGAVTRVEGVSGTSVSVVIERDGAERTVKGTHLLVAAGRAPNTDELALCTAGVEQTDGGHVKVDERLQTTAPNVWAVGDVTGNPQFTHVGFDDFRIVHANINGGNRTTLRRLVPFCLYTDPELARVGLNEKEAAIQGLSYRLFKVPMTAVMRSYPAGENRGFMKALVGDDDRILGFTAFGIQAGEVMSAVQVAMLAGAPYTMLRDAVLAHPTVAEGLIALFSTVPAPVQFSASATVPGRSHP